MSIEFCNAMLKPQQKEELLNANHVASDTVQKFFESFEVFNRDYHLNRSSALLPTNTCLIVKGPPGCGKQETVEFFMRQSGIVASHVFSLALESRNGDFVDTKLTEALNSSLPGSAIIIKDIDALSTNGKFSPSKKLFTFLDSPGMALHSSAARELRDRADPELAIRVQECRAKIMHKYGKASKTVEQSAAAVKRQRVAKKAQVNKETLEEADDEKEEEVEEESDEDEEDEKSLVQKKKAPAAKNRFARNTKQCVSKKSIDPQTLSALYRANYNFTTHVPIILIANDHQHHPLFADFKRLRNCTIVHFRQPPLAAISARIDQIFLQFNVKTLKPTKTHQKCISTEIASAACGDMRKAMRIVSIGIHRAIYYTQQQRQQTQLDQNQTPQYLALKRAYIVPLFDRQLGTQNDHFTAVSYLALDCPSLSLAIQYVARPRLSMVPYTIYQSFFRLLPNATQSEASVNRQKRQETSDTMRMCATPRQTQNSNKTFSLDRLKQKLFPKIEKEIKRIQKSSSFIISNESSTTAQDDKNFCVGLLNQFIGNDLNNDEKQDSIVLNRAAESICRADFEEVFSWADMVTQEFCCRRSPLLQQTWHDSTVAWAFMLRKCGENYPTYGFQQQKQYVHDEDEKVQIGLVESSVICNGRNSKNTGPCVKNVNTCTCRWLTAPSLKGDRGVRLQWFKSTVVERDVYDIKTRAVCQSSCDRFFYYTNYISSMQQVRKRGAMLVNLQGKTTKRKKVE